MSRLRWGSVCNTEYYLRASGAWEPIEAETWLADLRRYVPARLEIWKGVWRDLRTMQATALLCRRGDGTCCPTGGAIHATLLVESGRFFIEAVTLSRPRIGIDDGDADRAVPVEQTRLWAAKMKALKMTYEYHELRGVGHGALLHVKRGFASDR